MSHSFFRSSLSKALIIVGSLLILGTACGPRPPETVGLCETDLDCPASGDVCCRGNCSTSRQCDGPTQTPSPTTSPATDSDSLSDTHENILDVPSPQNKGREMEDNNG